MSPIGTGAYPQPSDRAAGVEAEGRLLEEWRKESSSESQSNQRRSPRTRPVPAMTVAWPELREGEGREERVFNTTNKGWHNVRSSRRKREVALTSSVGRQNRIKRDTQQSTYLSMSAIRR